MQDLIQPGIQKISIPAEPTTDYFLKDIFYENTAADYQKAMLSAIQVTEKFLENTKKPFSGISPPSLGELFGKVDFDKPLKNYRQLEEEINRLYVDHATAFHLPKYIAHLNCPVVIPALWAEVLISAINSSQDTWDQSAGGTLMERKLIDWTAEQIGYNYSADGVFTAGGSQSNLMGLLLARDNYANTHLRHNIKINGNPKEASKFRIFVSDKSHFSNQKNASLMGLGEQALVRIPTDPRFRMQVSALNHAIEKEMEFGNIPIAIVATAATTDFGNVDPLYEIGNIAHKYNLWLHVDAAYGCGLLLSDRYRHLLNGIEFSDSVTIDYHKSFFQPISSSAIIVRNKCSLDIIRHHADYLNPQEQDYEEHPAQINKTITQSTRRFDALKLWCTLRLMGREKLGSYIDKVIETTEQAAQVIESDPEFELLCHSDFSVLVFRYVPENISPEKVCDLNQKIKKTLFNSGEVLLACTKVNGKFYLKFTILNPITSMNDIREILESIRNHANKRNV
ncbi:diaminobutyrate decarboxylase [Sporocytophaga myxococcoides]|uniref:Diaminobutyrate decarboxylase n=1 Tax=Sporocytophaga myxococcoides TaxID=153721 RepID=A0A098LEK8_9BACT|nr:aspartate aminotransferase family protein [Sporocytophaga myxococcoides]GAL84857.1 diaminobutyrate decarboxylase [Sporocytophaga myxococcoides]